MPVNTSTVSLKDSWWQVWEEGRRPERAALICLDAKKIVFLLSLRK